MPDLSRRLLAVALGGAALLSALPQPAQARWSGTLAALVRAPLWPAVAGLTWVRDRIRAPSEPFQGLPEELRLAREESGRLRGELDAAELRVRELERQLGELSGYRPEERAGWRPALARVIERGGSRPAGTLGLDAGAGNGIEAGDPAVVGGNQLVGRVAEGVEPGRCWLVPLDARAAGRIDALVQPSGAAGTGEAAGGRAKAPRQPVLVQLSASGPRTFIGELEMPADGRVGEVRAGDAVVLSDATWRPAAQGMRIGTVESIGRLDSNPLRNRVTVRMEVDPSRLGSVVVKVRDRRERGAAP
jgi:cell shape-determining protein MreC